MSNIENDLNKVKYMFEFITQLNRIPDAAKRSEYIISKGTLLAKHMVVNWNIDADYLGSILMDDLVNEVSEKNIGKNAYGKQKVKKLLNILDDINRLDGKFDVANVKTIYKLKSKLTGYSIDGGITFHLLIDEDEIEMKFGYGSGTIEPYEFLPLEECKCSKKLSKEDVMILDSKNITTFSFENGKYKTIYPFSELPTKKKVTLCNNVELRIGIEDETTFDCYTVTNVSKAITVFHIKTVNRYLKF